MQERGVWAGGMVAFALLCAFSAWWIGPVAASRSSPVAVPAASGSGAPSNASSDTPSAAPSAQAIAAPSATAKPSAAPAAATKTAPPPSATPSAAAAPTAASAPSAPAARVLEADIAKQLQGKVIAFESKSDQLTARGKEVLDSLLPLFAKDPAARFVIEGHTDSWGDPAYNQALSERRARSVQAYLVGKGLEAKRFEAKGLGDARPIADNKSSAGSRKNRRIEFKAL